MAGILLASEPVQGLDDVDSEPVEDEGERLSDSVEPFHAITISRLAHRMGVAGRSIIHMEFG